MFNTLVTSPSKTARTCAFLGALMSIPLLFVKTLSKVGCGFFPNPSVIEPLSTGQGNFPLLALKLSDATFPSAVKTNFEAAVVPDFGAVVPDFAALRLLERQFRQQLFF